MLGGTSAAARIVRAGLCGQRPSDDPGFARFLVEAGIDSVSVTPDSFFAVKVNVAAAEHRFTVRLPADTPVALCMSLTINPDRLHLFDPETGTALG